LQQVDCVASWSRACCPGVAGERVVTVPRKKTRQTVVSGVERDLAALPAELAVSGLASSALEMARQLDGDGQPAAKAACARALARALGELRAIDPQEGRDSFDDLSARRAARRARGAA
jgi:hypothetical protein